MKIISFLGFMDQSFMKRWYLEFLLLFALSYNNMKSKITLNGFLEKIWKKFWKKSGLRFQVI